MAEGADVLDILKVVITTELSQFKAGMSEVRRTIDGLKPTVGALGLALTGLIASGFQNVVQSADSLRDVNRILQGLGYDVGNVGDKVSQMAQELADSTRYDNVEVTDAFRTLLSVTQDVEQAMMLWGPALDLAAAQGIPVELAAQAIARYVKDGGGQLVNWYPFLKNAGTAAERMKAIISLLSEVIGGAASRSANLAGAWADLKQQAAGALKSLVPEGLKGDGLIKMLNDVADAIKAFGEAIDAYLTPVQKELLSLGAVVAVLLAGPAGVAALAGALGLGGLAGAIGALGSILTPVAIAIGVLGTAWVTNFSGIREKTDELKATLRVFLSEIGSTFLGWLQGLGAWLKSINPIWQEFIVVVGLALAAIKPALGIFNGIRVAVGLFGGALNALLSPVVLITAGIIGIAAAGWYLYNSCAEVREGVTAIWNTLSADLKAIWTALKAAIVDIWNSIVETAKFTFEGWSKTIQEIWNGLKVFWDEWGAAITSSFGILWDTLKLTVETAINAIKDVIGLVLAIIRGDWGEAWDRIKGITKTSIDFIKGLFSGLLELAKTWGSKLLGNFIDGINSKVQAVKDAVSGVVGTVKRFLGFSSPAEEGPGADADKWMPNLVGMWADQLEAAKAQVSALVADIAEGLNINIVPMMAGIAGGLNIAPQINALAAAGGGGMNLTLNITGNSFRNREDVDYLRDQILDVLDDVSRGVGRGVSKWRG